MEDLIIKRSKQHDFETIQNQIICMRQRFENLQISMVDDEKKELGEELKRKE